MAEEKKPEAKPENTGVQVFNELVTALVILFILSSILGSFAARLGWLGNPNSWTLSRYTVKGIYTAHTRPIASLLNPIGAKVMSLDDTRVYNSPGDDVIGSQKFKARGTILQGPVEIDGVKYYYIDYEEDPDGWVREGDIGYIESEPNLFERFLIELQSGFRFVKYVLYFISALLIGFIIYLFRKITKMASDEMKLLYPENIEVVEPEVNPSWQRILDYTDSLNENDWKLAIIEADIMLGDLLEKMSLPGDTIGDKLKLIEKSDFNTIDNAWEAHKIRNMIAHEGASFQLNQREMRRVIDLYKSVFEEFEII